MSALPPRIPPRQVPVLTEVIEVPGLDGDEVAAVVVDEEPALAPLTEVGEAREVAEVAEVTAATEMPSYAEVAPVPVAPMVCEVPPALSALLEQPPVATADAAPWGLQEQVGHAGPVGTGESPAPANEWSRNVPSLADVPLPVQASAFAAQPQPPVQDAGVQAEEMPASDEQLTQRVLHEVQRHIDLMLEYRLRQVLGPILARAADGIVKDARQDLAATLRDVVARAVSQELARQRGK